MWRTSQITSSLVDRRSPALIESMRVEEALVNQETGIRGYGLSGRKDFLQPYAQGVADEKAALKRLRSLLGHDGRALDDLADVEKLAGTWRERIAQPVSVAGPAEASKITTARADEGKAVFDSLRRAMARQQSHLQDERVVATRDLRRATALRNWMFAIIGLVIALVAGLVFEGLRRGISGPLSTLGAAAREVARGAASTIPSTSSVPPTCAGSPPTWIRCVCAWWRSCGSARGPAHCWTNRRRT